MHAVTSATTENLPGVPRRFDISRNSDFSISLSTTAIMADLPICLVADSTVVINVTGTTSVGQLKDLVREKLSLSGDADDFYLRTGANILSEDSQTMAEYGIVTPFSHVYFSQRLLGGKVHGSLARAGKVRGQTPKVEVQEKKKKKTGRAKRRMQYNRRYVNVVATFGRKRGPNSNADAGANKNMA
ncbi:putative 40S ribosomal protein S30 [Hypsibius exemplaris]|uniref:40S ribosomal protein S30 n=1 Tax=Hypsibius exemplaris TaxID=2072580 RepID=A0A1W0WSC3_HYPEX|nr:putative 40S ribosomal protein S30 [Hypsibius exemplaris]